MSTETHPVGTLKVWYVPQVPMQPYERILPHHDGDEEKELALAAILLDTIISFSSFEFENRVKPDYSDMGGIERWEGDGEGGRDWYEVEDEEWEALLS